jgi:hypothetical protein
MSRTANWTMRRRSRRRSRERRIRSAAEEGGFFGVALSSLHLRSPGRRTRPAAHPSRAAAIARSARDLGHRTGLTAATPGGHSLGTERMEHRETEPPLRRPGTGTVRLLRWRSGEPANRPCAPGGLRAGPAPGGMRVHHNTTVCHREDRTCRMGAGEQSGASHKTT